MGNNYIFDSGLSFLVSNKFYYSLSVGGYPVAGILWNFVLLLIPFYCVKILNHLLNRKRNNLHRAAAFFIYFIWLMFIPNAAYIITDVRHLANECAAVSYYKVCPDTAWMIPFFYAYSIIGCYLFVSLLNQMRSLLAKQIGGKTAKLAIICIIPIISLGVVIGLINRLNSWEVFIRPSLIARVALGYFTNLESFITLISFTILFLSLYIFGGKISNKT